MIRRKERKRMAKKIRIDDETAAKLLDETRRLLYGRSFGAINFKQEFKDDRKASIILSLKAFTKMIALVHSYSTEVEWHGLVQRLDDNKFLIYDIIVPPHVVTGATVTADYFEYEKWLDTLDDDTFNNLRFHGHSHVNMGCTPSGTDMKYRRDRVSLINDPKDENQDAFYIFLIFNKRWDWTGEIYDFKNNALYENNDIKIDVELSADETLTSFIEEAKKIAKPEPVKVTKKEPEKYCYNTKQSVSAATSKKDKQDEEDYKKIARLAKEYGAPLSGSEKKKPASVNYADDDWMDDYYPNKGYGEYWWRN